MDDERKDELMASLFADSGDGGGTVVADAQAAPSQSLISQGQSSAPSVGNASSNVMAIALLRKTAGYSSVRSSDRAKAIVALPAAPTITTTSLTDGTEDEAYSATLAKTGAAGGTWSVSSGSLPAGMTLNASTGLLSGTPTESGDFNFTVKYTDPHGQSDTQALALTLASASYVSPFAAAGFSFVSARDVLTNAWDSLDDSTQHDGTDDADVRRLTPTGGALFTEQTNAADQFYYGDGDNSRAINGKPVYYTEVNGSLGGMFSDAQADAMLSGKEFDIIAVVNRLDDGNGKAILQLGANRPCLVRQYSSSVVKAYGFLTGYVEAPAAMGVGAHVLHVRFDNTAKKLRISVDGGAFADVAETADWSPDTGKFGLGKGKFAVAEYGLRDGLYADYATLVSELKTEYGIA